MLPVLCEFQRSMSLLQLRAHLGPYQKEKTMPTKMNTDKSGAGQSEKRASDPANVRPEPGNFEEKTTTETGKVAMQDFHFVARVNKSTPDIS
jgi:hypothetical protein